MPDLEPVLTVKEVAEHLGISKRTVSRLVRLRLINPLPGIYGNSRRFSLSEIKRYLNGKET